MPQNSRTSAPGLCIGVRVGLCASLCVVGPLSLTLLCPGALDTPGWGGADPFDGALPPALARAAVRSVVEDEAALPAEPIHHAWLRAALRLSTEIAIEPMTGWIDRVEGPALRLTPVQLIPGLDQLRLLPVESIDEAEAAHRAAELAPLLAQWQFELCVPRPRHWYLRPASSEAVAQFRELAALSSHSWRCAAGRSIEGYVPTGAHARSWRRLATEIEMTWHAAAEDAVSSDAPQANSLWLDGLYRAPRPTAVFDTREPDTASAAALRSLSDVGKEPESLEPLVQLVSDEPALQGLCGWLAAISPTAPACRPLSEAAAVCQPGMEPGHRVVICDDWQQVSDPSDGLGFQAGWQRFAKHWVQWGLQQAAESSRASSINVVLMGERRLLTLTLRPPRGWRFWRKARLTSIDWPVSRWLAS